MLLNRLIASPCPLQGRGFKTSEVKVLFFGEDYSQSDISGAREVLLSLGEAMTNVIK
jgi:hypothetical protein